jgi:probable phosphoglycerate mutase
MKRVADWLQVVAERRTPIVGVTHNGVLRAALALATGWDMLGKPPLRLRAAALHSFLLGPGGRLAVLACNVPLGRDVSTPDGEPAQAPVYPA